MLSDGVVTLRPWRREDRPALDAILDDPRLARWSSLGDDPDRWLAARNPNAIRLAIVVDDEPVGTVGIGPPYRGETELSYWLVPQARGRGIVHRAAQLLIDHVFATLEVERILLVIETDNAPSLAVAQALGATSTGHVAEERDRTGVARELTWFALLRP